ncbi:hypothetical protein [Caldibacillus thermoamylovorans]|uniref:hypothetical protein n=1 Tax=Caldibacillus thermoamylovorans TaxID=35841 RepID=UPI0022E0D1B3|nr:hypothetical protein [Caldibacillus thermoamylovorans]
MRRSRRFEDTPDPQRDKKLNKTQFQNQRTTTGQNSQSEIINFLVKKTLEKHNVQSDNRISPEEKRRLRNIFYQLQNEVNQFLTSMDNQAENQRDD